MGEVEKLQYVELSGRFRHVIIADNGHEPIVTGIDSQSIGLAGKMATVVSLSFEKPFIGDTIKITCLRIEILKFPEIDDITDTVSVYYVPEGRTNIIRNILLSTFFKRVNVFST